MIERLFNTLLRVIKSLKYGYLRRRIRWNSKKRNLASLKPNLKVYSDPDFLDTLTNWGEGTTWTEIQYLLTSCEGKALDIACGAGPVMEIVQKKLPHLSVYGFDIVDFLIKHAETKGIPASRLRVLNATKTDYRNDEFDYSYSIGFFTHLTEEGILDSLKECHRYTKYISFHQVPTNRAGKNEGWVELHQSFFNNSAEWWLDKFKKVYTNVIMLDSSWEDCHFFGKWFVCIKNRPGISVN